MNTERLSLFISNIAINYIRINSRTIQMIAHSRKYLHNKPASNRHVRTLQFHIN